MARFSFQKFNNWNIVKFWTVVLVTRLLSRPYLMGYISSLPCYLHFLLRTTTTFIIYYNSMWTWQLSSRSACHITLRLNQCSLTLHAVKGKTNPYLPSSHVRTRLSYLISGQTSEVNGYVIEWSYIITVYSSLKLRGMRFSVNDCELQVGGATWVWRGRR